MRSETLFHFNFHQITEFRIQVSYPTFQDSSLDFISFKFSHQKGPYWILAHIGARRLLPRINYSVQRISSTVNENVFCLTKCTYRFSNQRGAREFLWSQPLPPAPSTRQPDWRKPLQFQYSLLNWMTFLPMGKTRSIAFSRDVLESFIPYTTPQSILSMSFFLYIESNRNRITLLPKLSHFFYWGKSPYILAVFD